LVIGRFVDRGVWGIRGLWGDTLSGRHGPALLSELDYDILGGVACPDAPSDCAAPHPAPVLPSPVDNPSAPLRLCAPAPLRPRRTT